MPSQTALPDGTTFVLEKWWRIVGIIEGEVPGLPPAPPGDIYVRSSEFATMLSELRSRISCPEEDPGYIIAGRVKLHNAGTDSERTVAIANQSYMALSHFEDRAKHLITGRVK